MLELMKKGDLLNYLKERELAEDTDKTEKRKSKSFSPLSEHELWIIFKQVVAGVRYLHYQNIVHGDIKPQVSAQIVYVLEIIVTEFVG